MRRILVRIKILDKDQGFDLINVMMIETNLVEVWARQGLVHNVDCWLQIKNNIWIEIGLGKRKNINGFPPHAYEGWRNHVKKVILQTCSCNHKEDEISHAIKMRLANIP